ncbi:hypothetical protein C7212DRAFT_329118, partial [Tuber magnatum]
MVCAVTSKAPATIILSHKGFDRPTLRPSRFALYEYSRVGSPPPHAPGTPQDPIQQFNPLHTLHHSCDIDTIRKSNIEAFCSKKLCNKHRTPHHRNSEIQNSNSGGTVVYAIPVAFKNVPVLQEAYSETNEWMDVRATISTNYVAGIEGWTEC